jgi:hypothetical protein
LPLPLPTPEGGVTWCCWSPGGVTGAGTSTGGTLPWWGRLSVGAAGGGAGGAGGGAGGAGGAAGGSLGAVQPPWP